MPEPRRTRIVPTVPRAAVVPLVVALVAALALVYTVLSSTAEPQDGATAPGEGSTAQAAPDGNRAPDAVWQRIVRRDPDDPTALGDVDAPVVMVAYEDFQCTYCRTFSTDTQPDLVSQFVDDGTLRIEWRDFPYLGGESRSAAQAARAAGMQGRFWDYHDALYADQPPVNSGELDGDRFLEIAEQLGLDLDRFREDLYSGEVAGLVDADFQEGERFGVTGTPAFVINGVPVFGAQSEEVFADTIRREARRADGSPAGA